MFKFVNKRLRNRKGFTLIELIVVIAILGILALIAIPRFAGFTDKAKIQADEQYASIIGNNASVLLADSTFGSGGIITIGETGTLSSSGIDGWSNDEMLSLANTTALQYYISMTVDVKDDGAYTISGSGIQ